jgi:hypothetical protein
MKSLRSRDQEAKASQQLGENSEQISDNSYRPMSTMTPFGVRISPMGDPCATRRRRRKPSSIVVKRRVPVYFDHVQTCRDLPVRSLTSLPPRQAL